MTSLRDLTPGFEVELDKFQAEAEAEAGELMESVDGEVDSFGMHINVSVTTLVDAAKDKLVQGGVGALQEELFEGVTSMGGVSVTVLERKYLIDELAVSKRVLEQLEQDTSAFQG